MSNPSLSRRSPSRSPSKEAPRIPNESELRKLTVPALIDICTELGIDITDVKLKPEIINRMLGRTSPGKEASTMSYSRVLAAKKDPSSASAISAGQSEAVDFASLTAGSIATMSASDAEKKEETNGRFYIRPWTTNRGMT